jgi:Rrf2 family protein
MLSLSRKTDYALVAMSDLARRSPSTVSARDMAARLTLPLPALQNILTQLMHHELVVSVRGPRGGYRLSRRPEDITVADLIEAVGGPVRLTRCCQRDPGGLEEECQREDRCTIRDPVRKVHTLLRQFLAGITLDQVTWNRVSLEVPVREERNGDVSGVAGRLRDIL